VKWRNARVWGPSKHPFAHQKMKLAQLALPSEGLKFKNLECAAFRVSNPTRVDRVQLLAVLDSSS